MFSKIFSVAAILALIGVAAAQPVANVQARTCMCVPNTMGTGCTMSPECYSQK
ncbi:hypothetical protein J056_002536 [Wallemia ichthyophaga EXF-994]|uniref:Uncharacterized protein n=1 Tax=Wallemia ichthyophaga (strain EXF-994 / CBS 113033) TaxID=1299270 RepID=R9AA14_WALI9|nr:uncharacterized protein J056_002536 [Wallemia ichthyophaga EXF-994]EOQ99021.1 hypothetical protein J056_002536 [Wallemia ichthyophaga EXF-994]